MTKDKKDIKSGGVIKDSTSGYKGPEQAIVTRIFEQTKWRIRQDIDSWRGAIMAAENRIAPNRIYLYTLYEEIVLDAHIEGITGQRRDALLAEPFKIVGKDGNAIDDLSGMFKNAWFYDVLRLSHEAMFWGHSLIQLWNPIKGQGYGQVILVERRHVIPDWGGVNVTQGNYVTWMNYREPPYSDWLIEAMPYGPRGHGLFKIVAPDFIVKKNALMNWSQHTEIFGMPLLIGKTSSRRQADIDHMAKMLREMGSAARGTFQEGENIEAVELTKGDVYQIYDMLIQRCNSEASKAINHQTMTIEDGSSRSQAEVHERMMDDVKESDKRVLSFIVNGQLIPRMKGHGLIPADSNIRFEWETTVDKDALFDKVNKLQMNFDVSPEYIEEQFGIPVTPKQIAAPVTDDEDEDEDEPGANPKSKKPNPKGAVKGKEPAPPKKKALSLAAMFDYLTSVYNHGHIHLSADAKKASSVIDWNAFEAWFIGNPVGTALHAPTVKAIGADLWDAVRKVMKEAEPAFQNKMQENVYRFAAAKTYTIQDAARPLLKDDDGNARSLADFKEALKPGKDMMDAYQLTEQATTFSRAQIARQWMDIQKNTDVYPNLTWKGIGDSRERPTHFALNNLTLPANDPLWKRYTPGMDYNCRCEWEQSDDDTPVMKREKAQALFEAAAPPEELQGNPGVDGELIKNSHPYFKGNLKKVNGLDLGEYGYKEVK